MFNGKKIYKVAYLELRQAVHRYMARGNNNLELDLFPPLTDGYNWR